MALHDLLMTPRNWFGVALLFLFMPVNIPLWNIVFDLIGLNVQGVFVVPPLFLIGAIIIFYPSRQKKDSTAINNNEEE